MDSNELNKILGGVIGALLIFLLLNFASAKIYGTGSAAPESDVLAFAIDLEQVETAAEEEQEEEGPDLATLAANADPEAGARVFSQCRSCHKIEDGQNGIGPHLWGVVGRDIASVDGFTYSGSLESKEGAWTLEELSAFLTKPSAYAPGTNMVYNGLRKPEDRVNVIAYLNEADGTPEPLVPAGAAADAGAGEGDVPADGDAPAEGEAPAEGDGTTNE